MGDKPVRPSLFSLRLALNANGSSVEGSAAKGVGFVWDAEYTH